MWRVGIKIKGKHNNYLYKWEYFATYEEAVAYMAGLRLTPKQYIEAFYIKLFEEDQK